MYNPLHNVKKEAQKIRLSEKEKAVMRARLFEIMRRKEEGATSTHAIRSPYFFFMPRVAMPVAVLLIVALGGTTTYAAQSSLPGGLLYPIKIYVNEGVVGALAVSEVSKASFHTYVAEERLKEAETLASRGQLGAETALEIETNFNDHVSKADKIATDLEESDLVSGVEVRVALDSSLAAHSMILSRIGDSSDDEQTKENSASFAERVRSRLPATPVSAGRSGGHEDGVFAVALKTTAPTEPQAQSMALMVTAETASEASSSSDNLAHREASTLNTSREMLLSNETASQKKTAEQLQKKSAAQLKETRDTFDKTANFLSASTTAKIKEKLAVLQEQFDVGVQQMEDAMYEDARVTFTGVLSGSVELGTLIKASKTYKRDLVRTFKSKGGDESNKGRVAGTSTSADLRHDSED